MSCLARITPEEALLLLVPRKASSGSLSSKSLASAPCGTPEEVGMFAKSYRLGATEGVVGA